ncbi:MAG: exodeoxyribonuclease VII small subunit [Lentisphaerae bacterium]|nr:exodeoxyribonuclease VII small subunit [Lentisphaerota bacterium]
MMEEQELNLTFEEAMDKLEEIVSEMERGGIPLEQMMSKFEEGAKLAKYCQEKLSGLKKKMEILTRRPDGSTAWSEMAPEDQ